VWLIKYNYFKFTEDKSEWTGTTISFDISQKGDKTHIRVTHHGLVPEYECYDICSNAWTHYIQDSLYNLIVTGIGQPNSSGNPQTDDERRLVASEDAFEHKKIDGHIDHNAISIRPFLGSMDFNRSRNFYQDLGFEEVKLFDNLSYFKSESVGFYLQDAYVKDWIDNSMVFMEVDDVHRFWNELEALNLPSKYSEVQLIPVRKMPWGSECFVHDPSGILWHFGEFNK